MLKGTTTIELTDINTGEKQVIKENNMITNAVSEIFQPVFGHLTNEPTLRGYLPAYATILGGIFLFDSPITEDADCIFAPAGPSLTGCARYGTVNASTGLLLGNYNSTESTFNSAEKKMKFVYDFNTSQGNGVISSICLSNVDAGYGGYHSDIAYNTGLMRTYFLSSKNMTINNKDSYSSLSVGSEEYLFAIDIDNDINYYFSLPSTNSIKIHKRRTGLKNYSLFSTNLTLLENTHSINLTTSVTTSYSSYNFDPNDNALYIITPSSSSIAANATFLVTKIAFNTWEVTQYTMTNTTGVSLYTYNRYSIVHKGYVYLQSSSSNYTIYKMELGNSPNVVQLEGTTSSYRCQPLIAYNGRIYWQYASSSGNRRVYTTDEVTNKVRFCGNQYLYCFYYSSSYYNPAMTPVLNHPMYYYISCSTYGQDGFYMLTNYLATINNLSEPVTKTADKTMKITYTIQEE